MNRVQLEAKVVEQAADLRVLKEQVAGLARFVDALGDDSAGHDVQLASFGQQLAHLAEDVEDAQENADIAAGVLGEWAPTLSRLLPEFKRRHWPDAPPAAKQAKAPLALPNETRAADGVSDPPAENAGGAS